jgi:hypothetical protein
MRKKTVEKKIEEARKRALKEINKEFKYSDNTLSIFNRLLNHAFENLIPVFEEAITTKKEDIDWEFINDK